MHSDYGFDREQKQSCNKYFITLAIAKKGNVIMSRQRHFDACGKAITLMNFMGMGLSVFAAWPRVDFVLFPPFLIATKR